MKPTVIALALCAATAPFAAAMITADAQAADKPNVIMAPEKKAIIAPKLKPQRTIGPDVNKIVAPDMQRPNKIMAPDMKQPNTVVSPNVQKTDTIVAPDMKR